MIHTPEVGRKNIIDDVKWNESNLYYFLSLFENLVRKRYRLSWAKEFMCRGSCKFRDTGTRGNWEFSKRQTGGIPRSDPARNHTSHLSHPLYHPFACVNTLDIAAHSIDVLGDFSESVWFRKIQENLGDFPRRRRAKRERMSRQPTEEGLRGDGRERKGGWDKAEGEAVRNSGIATTWWVDVPCTKCSICSVRVLESTGSRRARVFEQIEKKREKKKKEKKKNFFRFTVRQARAFCPVWYVSLVKEKGSWNCRSDFRAERIAPIESDTGNRARLVIRNISQICRNFKLENEKPFEGKNIYIFYVLQ